MNTSPTTTRPSARARGAEPRGRRRRWPGLVMAAVVVAVVVWIALTAVRVASAAADLRTGAESALAHARDLDVAAVSDDITTVASHARELQGHTDSPAWTALSVLPVLGATAQSTSLIADSAVSAAAAAERLQPLLPRLAAEELRSPDGTIDTDTLTELAAALRGAGGDLSAAAESAAAADPGSWGPVGPAVAQIRESVSGLPDTAAQGADALDIMARMLGAEGRRRWAVLLQNGSEARGSGGFLGAYALVAARDGAVDVQAMDTNNSLTTPIPNRDMPQEFLDLWTPQYTSAWNDYNLSRHFPYTAQLTANGFTARGTPVTDVVALDAAVVGAMLAGTGPVSAAGATVSGADAVTYFNRTVYEQFPDSAAKDAAVVGLMRETLDRVFSGDVDLPRMIEAMVPVVSEGRLLVWNTSAADQRALAQWPVGGAVPDERGPWLSVALNNSAGNKLDAFVAADVDYRSGACGSGESVAVVRLDNDAPPTGSAYAYSDSYYPPSASGGTSMWVAVYGPVGAQWKSATIDGKKQWAAEGRERRHPVWLHNVEIPQGGSTEVQVRFREPTTGGTPEVSAQPMAVPMTTTASCS